MKMDAFGSQDAAYVACNRKSNRSRKTADHRELDSNKRNASFHPAISTFNFAAVIRKLPISGPLLLLPRHRLLIIGIYTFNIVALVLKQRDSLDSPSSQNLFCPAKLVRNTLLRCGDDDEQQRIQKVAKRKKKIENEENCENTQDYREREQ